MPHPLPRAPWRALTVIRIGVIGAIVVAGWATRPTPSGPDSGYAGYAVDDGPSRIQRVLDRHDCSPASAIVRSAAGRLRFVSFDTGWRVFTHHRAGTLVAVCLDEPPP